MQIKRLCKNGFIVLLTLFMLFSLAVFTIPVHAVGVPNVVGGKGASNGAYQAGWMGFITSEWGARVTLVDATSDRKVLVNGYTPASVDYVSMRLYNNGYMGNAGGAPTVYLKDSYNLGGLCKSDYVIDGATINVKQGYYGYAQPPVPKDEKGNKIDMGLVYDINSVLPRTLTIGNETNEETDTDVVEDYFTNKYVVTSFASSIKMDYSEVISGKYKLLIEPIAFQFIDFGNGKHYGFVGTPTEIALADRDGVLLDKGTRAFGYFESLCGLKTNIYKNYPSSMFLEKSEFGVYPTKPSTDSSGIYTLNDIIKGCALMTITFADVPPPTTVPVYYQIYDTLDHQVEYKKASDFDTSTSTSFTPSTAYGTPIAACVENPSPTTNHSIKQ